MVPIDKNKYEQISHEAENGQILFALINDQLGWLMYLRESGDAGFSSCNPNYEGSPSAKLDCYLSNGQRDEYPLAWALPVAQVRRAIEYFRKEQQPPPFIVWHNDSGDGTQL